MNKKPRLVLDTNILLVSISSRSRYHWIFQGLLQENFELVISNEILMEYDEIISKKFSEEVSRNTIRTLLCLDNVQRSEIYYNWALIPNDGDDNKFVDCAVASNADFIVTNDKHFKHLKDIDFPPIKIIDISGLKELLS
ncbi:MAG: putative toxin-antitoxin system toxin component, PIN family [bacterium]|nr:putative toxin-antitoxin system toxin component, PIN family [bacterium]